MSKTYHIPQAKHSKGVHFMPHIKKKFLQHEVMFNKTAMYYHGDIDQYDINKLFGISFGLHHTNSVRFGWRSVGHYSSKIEILAYCYVNGERVREVDNELFIAIVDIDKFYTYRINVDEKDYTLTIFLDDQVVGRREIMHSGVPSWGYRLFPYFGGNRKAPHDINIYFK